MNKSYRIRWASDIGSLSADDELMHFGIKGQRWGVRRFQNEDGTYTDAGRKRYNKYAEAARLQANNAKNDSYFRKQTEAEGKRRGEAWSQYGKDESKWAQKAIKSQNKANKYAIESDKKDMKKELLDAGVEIDKYSAKNQRKAAAAESRAVLMAKKGDEKRAGTEAFDKAIGDFDERRNLASIVQNSVSKDGSEMKSVNEARRIIREHPVVRDMLKKTKSAYDNLSKAGSARQKEEDAFYNDDKTYEKYLNKAVDAFMKEQKEKGNTAGWTRTRAYNWFKYDDGDQGSRSSIELYKKSGEGKKLIAAEKAEDQAYKTYRDACKRVASEYLGEYGDEPIKYYSKWLQKDYTRSTAERLSDFLLTRD